MSTKKNIFFNNYLETKLLIERFIFLEIERVETEVMVNEIICLRETIKSREEEALRIAELAKNEIKGDSDLEANVDSGEYSTALVLTEGVEAVNPENSEKSSELLPTDLSIPAPTVEDLIIPTISIDDLPTEDYIQNAYRLKITFLKKKNFFELCTIYLPIFTDFSIYVKLLQLIFQPHISENIVDSKLVTLSALINDSPKLFNFAYSINSTTDPRLSLFLLRLTDVSPKSSEKFFKLRLNKIRLKKKRKLRKLYIIKKLRKITFLRRRRKKFVFSFSSNSAFTLFKERPLSNLLIKRIPLSQRVIEVSNVEFFYKLNKDFKREILGGLENYFDDYFEESDDLLIYLRNYHQKPYLKLRKARVAHWHLFFNKTIRKQRYKGFINRFMKKYDKLSYVYTFFVNFFTNFKVSWSRTNKLESFCKTILIENHKNMVLKIPTIFSKVLKLKLLKKKNYYARKKVGKWSYLNFRRATCPWLQRKKNSPKLANHLQPNLFYLNYISQWDSMTGYIFLEEAVENHALSVSNEFKTNFLLKLHMYRYKSNKKCM